MQTIEEYKAYTQHLEGEVSKWHHAYDALVIERNALVRKILETEKSVEVKDHANGYECVMILRDSYNAFSDELEEYGKDRRMAILKFVRENAGSENWPITKIKFVMNGHTEKEYDEWKSFKDNYGKSFSYESYKYLISRKIKKCDLGLYRDYIEMAKECGHNVKDKYWYAPKNLKKAHDKVMAEVELVREARRQEQAKLEKKETELKMAKFRKVAKKFNGLITKFHGLTAYVPQDTETVDKHAKALHQCLVYADYIGKMARQKCLLVFIADSNGKPVATAEIMPGGKLGQFYADELHHNYEKMKPSADAEKALSKWLKMFEDSKVKLHPRKEAA